MNYFECQLLSRKDENKEKEARNGPIFLSLGRPVSLTVVTHVSHSNQWLRTPFGVTNNVEFRKMSTWGRLVAVRSLYYYL